jgi:hypothetical protein
LIKGRAAESILDSYDIERRPHAKAMIGFARFMGALVMPRSQPKAGGKRSRWGRPVTPIRSQHRPRLDGNGDEPVDLGQPIWGRIAGAIFGAVNSPFIADPRPLGTMTYALGRSKVNVSMHCRFEVVLLQRLTKRIHRVSIKDRSLKIELSPPEVRACFFSEGDDIRGNVSLYQYFKRMSVSA